MQTRKRAVVIEMYSLSANIDMPGLDYQQSKGVNWLRGPKGSRLGLAISLLLIG